MQFFEAKYVITCEPFPQTYVGSGEMSIKLNDQFLAVRDQYFAFEQSFDMGNGTTFTIWKRTAAPTRAEVEYLSERFRLRKTPSTLKCSLRWPKPGSPLTGCELALSAENVYNSICCYKTPQRRPAGLLTS